MQKIESEDLIDTETGEIINANNSIQKKEEYTITYKVGENDVVLTPSVVNMLTNGNKFITADECRWWMETCKMRKLNPLIKESYLVKYDNSKPAQQVTSIGAIERIADSNPDYDGEESGITVQTVDGKIVDRIGAITYPSETLLGGWCKAYRKSRPTRPCVVKISLKEYSKGQSTWNAMPNSMIVKCARAAALRRLFPADFAGMYTEDELMATGVIHAETTGESTANEQTYDISDTEVEDKVIRELDVKVPPKEDMGLDFDVVDDSDFVE